MPDFDDSLKIIQALFYLTGAVVAVMTYRAARRGLLNSVNTEYQKRVMDRLQALVEDIHKEFDPGSKRYWARHNPVKDVVTLINSAFVENRDAILRKKEFRGGVPISSDYSRLHRFLLKIKSDPFLPRTVREKVVDLFEARVQTLFLAYDEVMQKYMEDLAHGRYVDTLDENYGWLHNQINEICYARGCGISQIEQAVHELRLYVQNYFESFDPFR